MARRSVGEEPKLLGELIKEVFMSRTIHAMDNGTKSCIGNSRGGSGVARNLFSFVRETLRANASVSVSIEHSVGLLIGYAALGAVLISFI